MFAVTAADKKRDKAQRHQSQAQAAAAASGLAENTIHWVVVVTKVN